MKPATALSARSPSVPGRSVPGQSASRPTGPNSVLPEPAASGAPQQPDSTPQPAASPAPIPPAPIPPVPAAGRHHRAARAVIGDALRIPVLWCQFGSCIARYTHRDALGERDLRVRALAAGWRYDALGRLACPSCVQHDPSFWMTRPPVPVHRWLIPALFAPGERPLARPVGTAANAAVDGARVRFRMFFARPSGQGSPL
jgi:hypothetical protein